MKTSSNEAQSITIVLLSRSILRCIGQSVDFNFIKPMNTIMHFFDETEIAGLFTCAITSIKHLAMLQTLFYGCLRAFELCNLDNCDLDLKSLTLRFEVRGHTRHFLDSL